MTNDFGPARDHLACIEVVELITEYLDGALAPDDAALLTRHLAACRGCAAVLAQFREVIAISGRLGADAVAELDADRREPLLAAFRSWAAQRG